MHATYRHFPKRAAVLNFYLSLSITIMTDSPLSACCIQMIKLQFPLGKLQKSKFSKEKLLLSIQWHSSSTAFFKKRESCVSFNFLSYINIF